MNKPTLTLCSVIVLLGISSVLGFIGNPGAMAISVLAGAIGLAYANLDKIRRFKGAGFEAEMVQKIEAVVEKETEPEADDADNGPYWYSETPLEHDEQLVLKALANPAFTWRYIGGLSKESGLSKDRVKFLLSSLESKGLVEHSSNEKAKIWAPSRSGRNAVVLMAGDLNEA